MAVRTRTLWRVGAAVFAVTLAATVLNFRKELLPLFIAFALAYALCPLVDLLERHGVSRTLSAAAILVALAGIVAVIIFRIGPIVVGQMEEFISDLPGLAQNALQHLSEIGARFGVSIPVEPAAFSKQVAGALGGHAQAGAASPAIVAAHKVFAGARRLAELVITLFVIPIFFFFVVRDMHRAGRYVEGLIPPRHRAYARHLGSRIDHVLSGYIRGQLTVATIWAVVLSLLLMAIRIRFGLIIGLFAGFLSIVPFLGQFTGLVLALTMSLVDFQGFGKPGAVLAVFGVTHFVEAHFLAPKIVGARVGITPLWAIVALLVGGRAAGIAGMMLAV
ncbi:MAG: AI-2E family transporter, partial [Elusimicrobia bacterium]|nr:AI-2E family transporter [Elusimicrobiota bacterium]